MNRALITFLTTAAGTAALKAAVVTAPFVWNDPNRNWALAGTASQSSTLAPGVASRAIDGVTNGAWGNNSVTHTAAPGAWWEVNLGTSRPIDQIVLHNRTDCCGFRLSNFTLSALDGSNTVVWSQNVPGTVGVNQTFTTPAGLMAEKVRVAFNPGNLEPALSLAEVQILDLVAPLYANVATLGVANQSSTGFGGVASRAIDGNTNPFYGANSVTHTADNVATGSPVFWEVALPDDYFVNEIALFNRFDCCGDRLSNFRVSIFDGATETWGADYFNGTGSAGTIFSIRDESGGAFGRGDRVRVEYLGGLNNQGNTPGGKSLSLAEVQVFGVVVPEPSGAPVTILAAGATLVSIRKRRRRA